MEYAILLIALLVLSGFFSSAETAYLSLQRLRLEHDVREGTPGAAAVSALVQKPSRLLSSILIGNNLTNTGAAVLGGIIAESLVGGGLGALLAAVTVAALLVIFGEITPKTLALQHSFRIASLYVVPMTVWTKITLPLSGALGYFTRLVMAASGGEREPGDNISEAELRTMIGISSETGSVAAAEAELLDRVFHFGDRRMHEVMIPRNEAVWLARESKLQDFFEVYATAPHSRFPVFEVGPDRVVGILGIKDVLAALARGEVDSDSSLESLMRPAFFVPETKLIGELFREMQDRGVQMAIAVDEFGGTAGIVTLEQLLEEMVGQMRDELRPGEVEILEIDEHTTQVDGSLSVEEAREELEIDIPEGPYDTIAGFMLASLGHIPEEGEELVFGEHRIIVEEMQGPKIERLRIERA